VPILLLRVQKVGFESRHFIRFFCSENVRSELKKYPFCAVDVRLTDLVDVCARRISIVAL
jgi:hypothetical protein